MKYLQTDRIPEDLSFRLKKIAKRILRRQARLILKKYKPKVIAITGSVGKTLTKEAIYLVLSKKFFVRKSEKSFTAEIGVPLTIIGCPYGTGSILQWVENILFGWKVILFGTNYPEWLILEIDNDKPGDLKMVSSLISPDMLVMTEVGEVPAHIESFGSVEEFVLEKKTLLSAVKKDGVIVYNADDETVASFAELSDRRRVSCGLAAGDIRATPFEILYGGAKTSQAPTGMSFEIGDSSEKHKVVIFETLGVQNEYASLLAFAIGWEFGINAKDTVQSLNKYPLLPGRMRLVAGIKDTLILDDSYNSSPEALKQAIKVLEKIKSNGRKIAVVGDMLELGKFSAEEHRKAALELKGVADFVCTVGFRARKIAEELLSLGFPKGNIEIHGTSLEAGKSLQKLLQAGDTVLVKGSQGMRMEKTVEEVMRHPSDKKKILVRQNAEWIAR